eukprot:XP_017448236.1 PREDICTED: ly49 stimulatory receptor 6 isoform X2 [Rattus norvegicus]
MSKQDVPCSTVRFKKSSGLLYQVRPEETQRPREAGCRVPWQLTVIAIGILLSLRLVAVAMLVTNSGCVEMHWLCYGIKCYYFIMDKRTWRKCIQTCQNYSLSFLKIHSHSFVQNTVVQPHPTGFKVEEENKFAEQVASLYYAGRA